MHARRPQSRRVPTSIGGTAIAYDAGSRNDPNMKYVRLVSANEQASTSYAMTTNFQPTQELFPNAQVITGTSPDGAIVEYVIDQRDFDPSGIPPTMYVEVMPNMHAPGQQQEEEPQLNEEEVLAIENGYLNAIDAPVKKSRYSRMSEADRERYNARRRQRRLEKKKKKMEEDALAKAVEESLIDGSQPIENIIGQQEVKVIVPKTEQIVTTNITPTPQFLPIPDMKVPIEEEKTSRTETARNRYHAMTEDERKVYNQKRASAFRKRRKEEEILLSTPPECSSPGRISRAQEIVVRNAKRAEKARLRYQRMTVEERREYNHRRTVAKKARRLAKSQALREAAALGQNRRQPQQRSQQQPRRRQQQQQRTQQQLLKNPSQSSNSFNQQRTFENGLNTDIVNEEALSMLERDVVRRTQVAQMALMKQQREKQNRPFNTIDDTIEQVATYGAALPLNEPKDHTVVETVQDYIEPSTLPLVIVDQHGNPANLPEGSIIEVRQEHPNGPQTIIIHTAPPPPLNHRFIQPPQPSMVQFVTTSMAQNALPLPNYVQEEPLSDSLKPASNDSLNLPKSEILRARRAERARQRYHNMAAEERKQFNAKRAVSLRNARVRDEELCRLGEEARKAGNELNNDTMKAINAAQQRRLKRAESARLKYQRMSVEERRIYNQNRDNNRRAKKRDSDPFDNNEMKSETSKSEEVVVDDVPLDYSFE